LISLGRAVLVGAAYFMFRTPAEAIMADPFDFEKPARYAVMGNPVAHSSRRASTRCSRQFKHHIEYTAIQVDTGGFAQAVEQFRANGGAG